uniref:N(6)-L-threonylcarbamoyladenine synthase n=1 Tax=Albugo laibachii Nc14 TaxID=890382 RepID=F0W0H9_9STRA|nr:Osialoglycoprotein endopeptidase putative [Albugo laibachii Nc14]|eukprot:CCA14551.1 Osialoglycoprotein endopeptidase putative [Albugo laibachii Nc14]
MTLFSQPSRLHRPRMSYWQNRMLRSRIAILARNGARKWLFLRRSFASDPFILGIETSCDDTGVAILDEHGDICSNIVSSQWELQAKWKGVVPALAARAHETNLPHVIQAAIEQSNMNDVHHLRAIAVTSGPGLSPCLDVGLSMAKQLCLAHSIPFIKVNHLEAHILVAMLPNLCEEIPLFPFLVLLVSGGHCCLVLAKNFGEYQVLGSTLDDSVGEAFDKVARLLQLSGDKDVMHGGKLVETMALQGDPSVFRFTEPMRHRADCDFSYSGIKSAMLRRVQQLGEPTADQRADLCAAFQQAAVNQLVTKTERACLWGKELLGPSLRHLVVCGGVASNQYLFRRIEVLAETQNMIAIVPPARYCTDNGAMIAFAGLQRYHRGTRDQPVDARYDPRWRLQDLTPPGFASSHS